MKRFFNYLGTCILAVLLMAATVYGQKENVGTTGAAFLKLGVGARAAALGYSAFTLAEDASALYWNPAAMAEIRQTDLTLNYNHLYADMKHSFLGLAMPVGEDQTFGLGMVYYNTGKMERTEAGGSGAVPYTRLGSFSNYDAALMMGYGASIATNVNIGLGVKGIYERLGDESAFGVAGDIGIFAKIEMLDVGIAVKNIGTKLKFKEAKQPLPLQVLLGTSVHLLDDNLLLTASGGSIGEGKTQVNFGAEYRFDFIAFRAGYRTGYADVTGSMKGLTAGVGLCFNNIRVDYAYNAFGDLGGVHLISLGFILGEKPRRSAPRPMEFTPQQPIQTQETVTPAATEDTAVEQADTVVVEIPEGVIIPASITLYAQATTKSKAVVKVKKNDKVKVLEEKGTWCQVETAAGKKGWTLKKNVKMNK